MRIRKINKQIKVIQILCHSLENDDTRDYHVIGNWCARLARSILNFTNKYRCEVWYPIKDLDEKIEFIKDGIYFKLFPAKTVHKAIESYFPLLTSPALIESLKREDVKNTIIHFQGERGSLLHKVLKDFHQFKITIQYHGYGQPSWLDWFEKLFITPLERINFKNASHFFVNIKPRLAYLREEIHISPDKISYQNVGIDFNLFKPRNKMWARKKLKLPLRSFILLHIGNLTSHKGVDKIMKAYRILKKKYLHLFLLFIGSHPSHPLYKRAEKVADRLISKIPYKDLPFYYNAADVYCYFGNNKNIRYQGIGTAPTEALASNLNVVSTNLIHFPDKIIDKIGFIPKNFNDFVIKLEFLINNPEHCFNPRNETEPYTSYKYQTNHLLKVYAQLFAKQG